MRIRRRHILLGVGAGILLLGIAGYVFLQMTLREKGNDKGLLADLISRALSTPAAQISIGDVAGVLTSDVTVSDVSIADQDGVWLKLDRVHLVWRRTALLMGKLEIDRLDVGHLAIARKPLPSPPSGQAQEALLPELPVKVELKSLALAELALGAPLLGTPARLSATGNAVLGNPAEGLNLKLDARRLDAQGVFATRLDYVPATGRLDTAMTLDEAPGGLLVRLLGVADLPAAKFDLHGSGTLDAFTAQLNMDAGPGTGAEGRAQLGKQGDARRLTLDLGARIEGLLPAVVQPIFAGTTRLTSSIDFARDGAISISPLSVVSSLARMDITGGLDAAQVADLDIKMRALPNAGDSTEVNQIGIKTLALDAKIAGALSGPQVTATAMLRDAKLPQGKFGAVDATFSAMPEGSLLEKDTAIKVTGQASASGIAASDPALASAIGSSLALQLAGTKQGDGVDVQVLQLRTDTATASFKGNVGGPQMKGRAEIAAPDLARFGALAGLKLRGALAMGANLSGNIDAALDGKLTGFATGLDAVDGLTGETVTLGGTVRTGHGLRFDGLHLDGAHVSARVDGDLTALDASLHGRAEGHAHLAKLGECWQLSNLDLRIGSVSAQGGLTLDADQLVSGQLTAKAGNLKDLAAQFAGSFDARLDASNEAGGQNAQLVLRGQGLKHGSDAIGRIDAQLALRDLWRHPVAQGDIAIDNANVAGEAIASVRAAAANNDLTLKINGRRIGLDAKARLVPGDAIRLDLAALNARYETSRVALARPASVLMQNGDVTIRDFALAMDKGSLSINGTAGKTLDLTVLARAVPLAIANAVAPSLKLAGTLDAQARITGTAQAPLGDWRVAVSGLAAAPTRDFALAPLAITASGRLADGLTTLDAQASAPRLGQLHASGRVPLQRGSLDVAVKGALHLAAANGHLAPQGRRLGGRGELDLRVTGALAKPKLNGAATVSGGTFDDVELGTKLTGIAARIAARGDDVAIERFAATSANGGSLSASGNVRIDMDAGLPGALQLSGRDVLLASNAIMKLRASPDLRISGPLMRDPKISGRIAIDGLDINVPERLPSTLKPLAGTQHVDAPDYVRRVIAQEQKARARSKRAPPFDAALDLTINAPNRIFVRGRGIDAELGGDMRLTGRMAQPVTIGAFEMRRGKLQVAGTRLDFSRGRATFSGEVTPELDFLATTQAADVTAQIAVTGIASAPTFTFSSSPDLPQDEVLSRIMFSKASGGLSPFQAVQLAQMVAQFSGDGGPDTMERLRRSLGVDALDISTGGSGGGPSVGAARAINNRVSVGVKGAASAKDSAVTLDIDLTRRLRLQGEASGTGATSLGIGTEIEY